MYDSQCNIIRYALHKNDIHSHINMHEYMHVSYSMNGMILYRVNAYTCISQNTNTVMNRII